MENEEREMLKSTDITTHKRGERTILAKIGIKQYEVWPMVINEAELAAMAYFAILELTPLLLVIFAQHTEAASDTQIGRVQDSLSWIAESLGGTPEPLTDKQTERLKELTERLEATGN